MNLAHVQVGEQGEVVRIFRTTKDYISYRLQFPEFVKTMSKAAAVGEIRRQVFERAKNACEWCGTRLTWDTGEMHERIHRGDGGEQSLANCIMLCRRCHTAPIPSSAHGNRRWHTAKVSE